VSRSRILEDGRGFCVVIDGESYWLDVDARTKRVTIDLQHHGMMGQPGIVERVAEGLWSEERIAERTGSLAGAVFDAAEGLLGEHLRDARRSKN
jgi:hypothetical protein